jgi:hypothetical protein
MKYVNRLLLLAVFSSFALLANEVENVSKSISIFNKKSLTFSKDNHLGLSIWKSPIIPVKENISYTGTISFDCLIKNTGSIFSVRLVLLDAQKRVITAIDQSGSGNQSLFSLGNYNLTRTSPVKHKAKYMNMEVVLAGNPSKIKINSCEIKPTVNKGLFKGIYTKKSPKPVKEEVLLKLHKLPNSTAKVIKDKGILRLTVDNQIVPIKSYKGAIDYKELNAAGCNVILSFNAGLSLFWSKMSWDLSPYRGNGKFDFTKLEEELLFIHNAAPKANNIHINFLPILFIYKILYFLISIINLFIK